MFGSPALRKWYNSSHASDDRNLDCGTCRERRDALGAFLPRLRPEGESTLLKHTPLSPSDVEDVIHETLIALIALMPAYRHDRAGKGAFHSLVLRIAQNKAYDLLRRETRAQNHRVTFVADPTAGSTDAAEPHISLELSDTDWRRELCAMALRRVLADPTIRSSSKIAFRRYAILGEPAARVAADLGISVNALYQIKNRLTERLTAEVRTLEAEDEAAPQ